RHARRFDGPAGSRVRTQSLAGDHRAWTVRRESFCFVLFRRPTDWLSGRSRLLSINYQRFNRRESKSKPIGDAMRIRLKFGCSGFSRKFVSAGLTALGTASTAERRSATQRSPISLVSMGGGWIRQFAGSFLVGNTSVMLSGHSRRNALKL